MISSETSPREGVTFGRVLAAEWTKLSGLPSTLWTVLTTVTVSVVLAFVLGAFARDAGTELVTSGHLLAQLGLLVLGVLVGSGEFSSGTAVSTFGAVPRRWPVLTAQVLLAAAMAVLTAVVVLAGSVAVSGVDLDLGSPEILSTAGGFVLQLVLVTVLAVGVGALLRRPTSALTTLVVVLVVLEQFLAANPGPVADTVRALSPSSGTRLFADVPDRARWGGGAVLAGWTVLALAVAAFRLRRHDIR